MKYSKLGYKRYSPDLYRKYNIIPSGNITMRDVDFPVYGIDNLGNQQMMYPGNDYTFPGNEVLEIPQFGKGGLKQWFDEKWVDIKTGKPCGRSGKDKNGRPYPACRPSRRVNSTTPKTASELSAAEKAKFKRKKTSGKRIDYNHKRAFGGSLPTYQDNGQVSFQSLDPRLQNGYNSTDATYVAQNIVDPYIATRSETQRLIDENNQQTISSYVEPSTAEKLVNRLANPFTTAGYVVRGQQIPDRVVAKDNVFDMASDVINPVAYLEAGNDAINAFGDGDVIGGALSTAGALPFFPGGLFKRGSSSLRNTVIQPGSRRLERTLYAPNKVYGRGMPSVDAEMTTRFDLVEQYNARNNAYHTVNITDDLRNNEYLRERAKVYGYNPDSDRDLALFLGSSPGGTGRRTGYEDLLPEGYDFLYSGNNPIQTLGRYGDFSRGSTPYTTKFRLFNDNTSMLSDRDLFERIQALDGVNTNRPDFRMAPISTFYPGDDISKLVQGNIVNTNTLHVPGLNQTNIMVGRVNTPVRQPVDIRAGSEMNGWPSIWDLGTGEGTFTNPSDYDFYFKQKGGSLPSYQDDGQVVELVEPGSREYSTAKYSGNLVHVDPQTGNPWITLPSVEIDARVDYNKYPYYNDLTEKEKEWFNQAGENYGEFFSMDSWTAPIMSRNARRKARIGKDKVTMADEVHTIVDPVLATVMTIPAGAVAGSVSAPLTAGYRAATPTILRAGTTASNLMNAPLTVGSTTVPAVTANNLLGAYGATDFALNRAPVIPGQIQRGEYSDAAFNVGMGALDMFGLKYTGAANPFLNTDFSRGLSDLTRYRTLSNERDNAGKLIENLNSQLKRRDEGINFLNQQLYKITNKNTESPNWLRKSKLWTNQTWGEDSYVARRRQNLGFHNGVTKEWDVNNPIGRAGFFETGRLVPGNQEGFELIGSSGNGLNASITNKGSIIDFNTGNRLNYDFNFPSGERSTIRISPDGNAVTGKLPRIDEFTPPEGLSSTVSGNINLIENQIPGFKVFGSSRGVADAGFPHVPGDYDGIITKANYDKMIGEGKYPLIDDSGFAKVHEVDINGNIETIDFNVIEETADGVPTGKLAEQLYRNLDPQGYYEQAARVTSGEQKAIDIPYTADELIENTNWSNRTIADAFETPSSGAKAKHINRPDVYIAYGDVDKLQEGFEAYAKSFLGDNVNLGPKFSVEQLSNVDDNLELLKAMQYPGDIRTIASSPERMQVALQDYYLNKTTLSRGINRQNLIGGTSRQNIEDALTEWNVDAAGGNANGMGLNNVQLGDSGYGDVYSHKQFSIPTRNSSPKEFVESIINYTDGTAPLSTGEIEIIQDILNKHNVNVRIADGATELTMKEILTNLPGTKASESVLNDIAQRTGRRYSIYNEFGDSRYAGSFGPFNNDGDILVYGNRYGDTGLVPTGKGLLTRAGNYNRNSFGDVDFSPYLENPTAIRDDWYRATTPGAFDKVRKRTALANINDQLTSPYLGPSPFKINTIRRQISEAETTKDVLTQRILDADRRAFDIKNRLDNAQTQALKLGLGAAGSVPLVGMGYALSMDTGNDNSWINEEYDEWINRNGSKYDLQSDRQEAWREHLKQGEFYIPKYQDKGEVKPTRSEKVGRNEIPENKDLFSKYVMYPALLEGAAFMDWYGPKVNEAAGTMTNLGMQALYSDPRTAALAPGLHRGTNEWLFENVRPVAYPTILTGITEVASGMMGYNAPPSLDADGDYTVDEEAWRRALGLKTTPKYIVPSQYKPSTAEDPNAKYYTISPTVLDRQKLIQEAQARNMQVGDKAYLESMAPYIVDGYMSQNEFSEIDPLQRFKMSVGEDDKGRYLSIYDKYDLSGPANELIYPYEFYDRVYYKRGGRVPRYKANLYR